MIKSGITYSKKFSGMMASLTAFVCGALIFARSATFDLDLLIHGLSIIIPAAIIVGYLGFQIGKIFDVPRKKRSLNSMLKNKK